MADERPTRLSQNFVLVAFGWAGGSMFGCACFALATAVFQAKVVLGVGGLICLLGALAFAVLAAIAAVQTSQTGDP